jgi:hypothetical protein
LNESVEVQIERVMNTGKKQSKNTQINEERRKWIFDVKEKGEEILPEDEEYITKWQRQKATKAAW